MNEGRGVFGTGWNPTEMAYMLHADVTFLAIGRNRPGGAWHMPPHRHTSPELVVVTAGRQWVSCNGGAARTAPAGSVLLFAPGVSHEEGCAATDGLETIFLQFECAGVAAWPALVRDDLGRIRQLAAWLLADRDALLPRECSSADALLGALLAEYLRLCGPRPEPVVERLRAWMREHLDGTVTLDVLARQAGMSKFHLVRQWKRWTGRTPMADMRLHRAHRARELLQTSRLTLKEIAPRVGLNDEITLSRVFRRCFGAAPGALRRPPRAS